MADLEAAFNAMDVDGSGYLERQEVIDGLKANGYNFTEPEVDEMIASVDVDGNGKVDYHGNANKIIPFCCKSFNNLQIFERICDHDDRKAEQEIEERGRCRKIIELYARRAIELQENLTFHPYLAAHTNVISLYSLELVRYQIVAEYLAAY